MEYLIGLQVRTMSTRLPCKAFLDFQGIPLIGYLVKSLLTKFPVQSIFALTTSDSSDDYLAEYLRTGFGISVLRGDTQDVQSRFLTMIQEAAPETVVRITGDNPFVLPSLIAKGLDFTLVHRLDYLSNKLTGNFPKGLDFEIFTANSFLGVSESPSSDYHREHVTPGLLELARAGKLRAGVVACLKVAENVKSYTIDSPKDYLQAMSLLRRQGETLDTLQLDVAESDFSFEIYSPVGGSEP